MTNEGSCPRKKHAKHPWRRAFFRGVQEPESGAAQLRRAGSGWEALPALRVSRKALLQGGKNGGN